MKALPRAPLPCRETFLFSFVIFAFSPPPPLLLLHLFNSYPIACFYFFFFFSPQDSSLINIPITGTESGVKGSVKGFASGNKGWVTSNGSGTMGTKSMHENGLYNDVVTSDMDQFYSSQFNNQYGAQSFGGNYMSNSEGFDNRHLAQDTTLIHNWQTNGRYLHEVTLFLQ